ncbi:MAG: FAD-dependent monooxygenase, partial [Propionibacteriaceae bacterium]
MARDREDRVRDIVVIGGSSTGLLAASALSGAGRHVTIVERDTFPDKPQPRPGVPQGRQAHVFLYRGLLAAEELLPGLREDLLGAGAVAVNGGQLLWLSDQGWLPNRDAGFELLSATRPLLEHVLRQRTLALPHVSALDNTRVTGLARTQRQWEVLLDDGTRLTADLVVDASGRGSRLPHWLADHGVTAPPASVIDAHVGYATRIYRDAPAVLADCAGIAVAASP